MSCKNDGCNGNTRRGQYFCYDCYQAWSTGGSEAVQARIDALHQPDLSVELLRRLDERDATIESLKSDVVELGTFKDSVLKAINGGRIPNHPQVKVETWALGKIKEYGELARPVLHERFREARQLPREQHEPMTVIRELNQTIHGLERQLADMRGQRCQPSTCKHPSADPKPEMPITGRQLDRIESLAKQAAQRGPSVSSVFLTLICTVLIGGGIFIW